MESIDETILKKAKNCTDCGEQFMATIVMMNGSELFGAMRRCDECWQKHEERMEREEQERKRLELEYSWTTICPSTFRETDPELLPFPAAFNAATSWTYGPKGLLLCGEPGAGKTRSAWSLAKREHFNGRSVVYVDSTELGTWGSKRFENVAKADAIAARWESCGLLILDDPFKCKMATAHGQGTAAEELIFNLIDRRSAKGKPGIVTTNDTPDTLAKRFSEDRSGPIIRRLKEFYYAIAFT